MNDDYLHALKQEIYAQQAQALAPYGGGLGALTQLGASVTPAKPPEEVQTNKKLLLLED